jgi:ferredoxin like protein
MAAEVKSPSGTAKLPGLANFLGPPKLLGRDDKLATLMMKVDEGSPHLKIIDQGVCLKCIEKPCTVTCPVENYKVEDNGHTTIYWSNCIECGTCRIICPFHNISWRYPTGGFGMTYRYG